MCIIHVRIYMYICIYTHIIIMSSHSSIGIIIIITYLQNTVQGTEGRDTSLKNKAKFPSRPSVNFTPSTRMS